MKLPRIALLTLCAGAALAVAACGGGSAPADASASEAALAEATDRGSLAWATQGSWRMDTEKARDQWRHPVETLAFFGVEPGHTVVEMFPGGGWYTAVVGPYLKQGGGKLIAALPDPAASDYSRNAVDTYRNAFVTDPDVYGAIEITVASRDSAGIAAPESADVVLTFRNVHNWMASGYAPKMFSDAYAALKPGGVLGVVEHRLPSSRDQDLRAGSGYVAESYVTQLAEAAGFILEDSSEINANPKDTADHPLGVWMLPPNMRAPEAGTPEAEGYDPATYTAIGESDRMTLKFRKPG